MEAMLVLNVGNVLCCYDYHDRRHRRRRRRRHLSVLVPWL
jgi:hypothetical protein